MYEMNKTAQKNVESEDYISIVLIITGFKKFGKLQIKKKKWCE